MTTLFCSYSSGDQSHVESVTMAMFMFKPSSGHVPLADGRKMQPDSAARFQDRIMVA